MKKILLTSLALIFVLSTAAVAEVQNVKVGGQIRIRAYMEENRTDLSGRNVFPEPRAGQFYRWNPLSVVIPADNTVADHWSDRDNWISQRTQVYVEADLTDNVLVRVTLEACGSWGSSCDGHNAAGPATPTVATGRAGTEGWTVKVVEGWIQVSELYYSPLSVKVGRQYLNYGTGFIISDKEKFWNFDAVKAVLDFYPWTVDLVYAKLAENTTRYFQTTNNTPTAYNTRADWNLYGANIAYAADFWNVEAYIFGTRNSGDEGAYAAGTAYTTYGGTGFANSAGRLSPTSIEPTVVGLRADIRPIEQLDVWGEVVYEWGSAGSLINWNDPSDTTPSIPAARADYVGEKIGLSAWAADCGATYTFDWTWEPAFTLAYTFASGEDNNVLSEDHVDSDGDRIRDWKSTSHAFYPLFGYDYYGHAFSPRVSNIHIFNAGLSLLPLENVEIVLDYYHYAQVKHQECELGAAADLYPVVGNQWIDNGGISAPTDGESKDLGDEIDVVVNYDYSEDLSCQLVVAYFMPGSAFDDVTDGNEVIEIRGELKVNF